MVLAGPRRPSPAACCVTRRAPPAQCSLGQPLSSRAWRVAYSGQPLSVAERLAASRRRSLEVMPRYERTTCCAALHGAGWAAGPLGWVAGCWEQICVERRPAARGPRLGVAAPQSQGKQRPTFPGICFDAGRTAGRGGAGGGLGLTPRRVGPRVRRAGRADDGAPGGAVAASEGEEGCLGLPRASRAAGRGKGARGMQVDECLVVCMQQGCI